MDMGDKQHVHDVATSPSILSVLRLSSPKVADLIIHAPSSAIEYLGGDGKLVDGVRHIFSVELSSAKRKDSAFMKDAVNRFLLRFDNSNELASTREKMAAQILESSFNGSWDPRGAPSQSYAEINVSNVVEFATMSFFWSVLGYVTVHTVRVSREKWKCSFEGTISFKVLRLNAQIMRKVEGYSAEQVEAMKKILTDGEAAALGRALFGEAINCTECSLPGTGSIELLDN